MKPDRIGCGHPTLSEPGSAESSPTEVELSGVQERLYMPQVSGTVRYRVALVFAEEGRGPVHRLDEPVVAADFFARQLEDRPQEELLAVFVDAAFDMIGWQRAFVGTLTRIAIDARPILQAALLCNAAGFIIGHNHPSSGNPLPSPEDLKSTQRLAEAGKAIGIELLDHIIVGERGRWVSMKRWGG